MESPGGGVTTVPAGRVGVIRAEMVAQMRAGVKSQAVDTASCQAGGARDQDAPCLLTGHTIDVTPTNIILHC
jgi:hypothetical protein